MTRHLPVDDPDVRLLAAAAHPVRLDMLRELAASGEVCGCGFRILGMVKQPTLSHHLRILREAGLVTHTREHGFLMYRLDAQGVARLRGVVGEILPPPPAPDCEFRCCSDEDRP